MLAGYPDPRRSYGAKELDLPFQRLLKFYRDRDPAPKPKLALPVHCLERIATDFASDGTPKSLAIADLVTTAFYFLLRVGEHTMPRTGRRTRAVQFRVQDISFRRNGIVLPTHSPLPVLLTADHVTLVLDNQKNGIRGAVLHHHAINSNFCPVKALARRVHSVMQATGDSSMPISFIRSKPSGAREHVTDSDITAAVRYGVAASGLLDRGHTLDRVSSHSIRASGAMALKLNKEPSDTIKKLGRWSSDTFLTYIHSQIAALTVGVAARMSTHIPFDCIA